MQTIGERGDIWPGARGECVSWRRRREHESSSSERGEASEQQASSSQREREKQREDFPAKITWCLAPNTKQQGQYRMERSCRSIS